MDIYDELLNIVKTESDLEEFLTHENKWEYLYNFSNIRKNILEWYDFKSDAKLLEFGAECGALTGLFCERVKEVVSVEDDERKRLVNKARNEKYSNLKIVSNEELSEKSFDYITIIGNFSIETLKKAKKLLKPKGRLIIAIENKYGMKYWSGEERPDTYSRMQLIGIIRREGLLEDEVYYPIPDYVLPTEIYSSNNLPKVGSISANSPAYEKEKITAFDEPSAFDMVIKDRRFEEFANSFLIFAKSNS